LRRWLAFPPSGANSDRHSQLRPLSILVAVSCAREISDELAGQLTADGHDVYQAHHSRQVTALLAARHVDVLILGALEQPAAAPTLLRKLRAGALDPEACPRLPPITLAPLIGDFEFDALHAHEAGSDHHLPAAVGYLHQRAVLHALTRRARDATQPMHRVGAIAIDTATCEVRIAGAVVELRAKEDELLCKLASEPRRVFTKEELLRDIWGYRARGHTRTLDIHANRLRRTLAEHGAQAVETVRGVGYRLTGVEPPRLPNVPEQ
jgi:DNA-binding response OmpR family regulator